MIILWPDLTRAWARAGKLEPLHSKSHSKYPGRLIGVTLSFPNRSNRAADTHSKRAKGNIKLFLCSAYYPYDHAEQIEFYDDLDSFISNRPRNSERLLGADVNCNVGVRSTMSRDVVGPIGICNRNQKGKDLLYLLKSNRLRVLLTYFTHDNYVTYRNFSASKSPHMLDNFICCHAFFKRVMDCEVVKTGARRNHSPIQAKFKLTAIKLNITKSAMVVIDWEKIRTDRVAKAAFNATLHHSLMPNGIYEPTNGHEYTKFNELVLEAASATATKLRSEDRGWFHHSVDTLLPVIIERDYLLHLIRDTDPSEYESIRSLKHHLKLA